VTIETSAPQKTRKLFSIQAFFRMQKTLCFVIDTLIPVYQKQQVTCGYFSGSTALRMKVYEGASIEGTKTINELPRQHIHCHNFCYIDVALKALLLNI